MVQYEPSRTSVELEEKNNSKPRLFKRWIALSTGSIFIQWIIQLVSLKLIHWIVIYPVDSAIQRLNNRGQGLKRMLLLLVSVRIASHAEVLRHGFVSASCRGRGQLVQSFSAKRRGLAY